jgi:hypothetical protein
VNHPVVAMLELAVKMEEDPNLRAVKMEEDPKGKGKMAVAHHHQVEEVVMAR